MRLEHIGQIFDNPITLSLVPGVQLAKSYYTVSIQYMTESHSATMHHNASFVSATDLLVKMGSDVKYITVAIYDMHRPQFYLQYTMRVDHLILLNLAEKLIRAL